MERETYDIGEKQIIDDMVLTDNIYVDIEFLKYIQLGKILTHKDLTQCQYTAIYELVNGDEFKSRMTDDVEVIFKSVPNLASLLNGESNGTAVFAMSPAFGPAFGVIQHFINMSDASKKIINSKKPTRMTIDTGVLSGISDTFAEQIAQCYSDDFQIEVTVMRSGFEELGEDILNFDTFFVANIARFNSTAIKLLDSERFIDRNFFCSKLLPLSKLPNLGSEMVPEALNNVNLTMSAAAKFHFVEPFTCLT